MASLLPPPTPAEIAAHQGPDIIAANLTVAILATIGVALRFWARSISKTGFAADDYFILVALPFGWGECVCAIIAVQNGLGRHLNTLIPFHAAAFTRAVQAIFASQLIWATSIPLIKISILLFYVRIFGRLRYLRLISYGLGVFAICWSIMVILVCALQCRPIQLVWDKTLEGTCVNTYVFYLVGSSLNTLTDFIILILPIPAVWNLKLSVWKRLSLAGIFLLGSLTCVISLTRLITLGVDNTNVDTSWSLGIISIWSTAEPCLGIFAACLPTLRPLFRKMFSRWALTTEGGSGGLSKKHTGLSRSLGSSRDEVEFYRLRDSQVDTKSSTYVTADATADSRFNSAGRTGATNVIEVETSTQWEHSIGSRSKTAGRGRAG
ncbi:MAG: hypothetical protein MMC33_003403 [Icmadophila ericetorum]|nr:hypothetical protein [Icmadophila ericetorum]